MTPPLRMGDEVRIIGPSASVCGDHPDRRGQKFVIDQISTFGYGYSTYGLPWYPASSLRLVEELKIGDWVIVAGKTSLNDGGNVGRIFRITTQNDHSGNFSGNGEAWYAVKDLRKLAPDEIAMHTGTCEYKMQELQAATSKGMAALGKLLAPIVEKHVEDALKRLSDIERRLNSIGPSHAELMGDVGALAEKVGAIENQLKLFSNGVNSRLDVLEGEMPEVVDCQSIDMPIRIVMLDHSGKAFSTAEETRADAGAWGEKVLDSMGEA